MIKRHFKFVGDFVHTAANRLGIPLIVLTKDGEATLATFTVGDEGISAGYILPPVIHEVTIKGTFSIDDCDHNKTLQIKNDTGLVMKEICALCGYTVVELNRVKEQNNDQT